MSEPWTKVYREKMKKAKTKREFESAKHHYDWHKKQELKQISKGETTKTMTKRYRKSHAVPVSSGPVGTQVEKQITPGGGPPPRPAPKKITIAKDGVPVWGEDISPDVIISAPPGTPPEVYAEHMTKYVESYEEREKKKSRAIFEVEKQMREIQPLDPSEYKFFLDEKETTKARTLEVLRQQKKDILKPDYIKLEKASPISPEAIKLYESYKTYPVIGSPGKGWASVSTAMGGGLRGFEFWASSVGIGKKKPRDVVLEQMTEIGRVKKKDLGGYIAGQFAGSPTITIATTPLLGYGAELGLAKLGAVPKVGHALGLTAKTSMFAVGSSVILSESYQAKKEFGIGETARASGRLARIGVGLAGFYAGAKAGQRIVLGRKIAEAEGMTEMIHHRDTGLIRTKARYDPKTDTVNIFHYGRVRSMHKGKIFSERFIKVTSKSLDAYLKPTPAEKMSWPSKRIKSMKLSEKGQMFSPELISKEIFVSHHQITIPPVSLTLMPSVGTFKPDQLTRYQQASALRSDFKSLTKGTFKSRSKTRSRSDTRVENLLGTRAILTPISKTSSKSITKQSTKTFQQSTTQGIPENIIRQRFDVVKPPPPAPVLIPLPGHLDLGARARRYKILPFKSKPAKKGYTPSLIGLLTGRTIKKPPKLSTGFGVRLPVKKSKKKPRSKKRARSTRTWWQ